MAIHLGTSWSLPCARRSMRSGGTESEPVASLECRVDQIKQVDGARLAHIKCNVVDPKIGDISNLTASQWLIAMRGGIWSVLDPKDLFWESIRTALPTDIAALRRLHPMIASPPHEDDWFEPSDEYSGTLYWHMRHGDDWCERQMPTGLGGGEHFYVQCFDRTGQLRGVALAKREFARIATACGSLADIPSWIFER
jgi:hypothetical protein